MDADIEDDPAPAAAAPPSPEAPADDDPHVGHDDVNFVNNVGRWLRITHEPRLPVLPVIDGGQWAYIREYRAAPGYMSVYKLQMGADADAESGDVNFDWAKNFHPTYTAAPEGVGWGPNERIAEDFDDDDEKEGADDGEEPDEGLDANERAVEEEAPPAVAALPAAAVPASPWNPAANFVPNDMGNYLSASGGIGELHLPARWSPIRFVLLMIPLQFMRKVVVETNRFAEQSAAADFPIVTLAEFTTFFGLLLLMALTKRPSMEDHWRPKSKFSTSDAFPKLMTWRRFCAIKRWLHLTDNDAQRPARGAPGYDPLWKLGTTMTEVVANFRNWWCLGKWTSLDEAMVGFKGRNPFKRVIPSKPQSIGFKLFALCCPQKYYCSNLVVDCAKGRTLPEVMELTCDGIVKAGQVIVIDRFYTTFDVMQWGVDKRIGIIGTCQANRFKDKTLLAKFPSNKAAARERGDFEYSVHSGGKIVACAWQDSKRVLFYNTGSDMTTERVRRKQPDGSFREFTAPHCATLFNEHMQGVDRSDQLRSGNFAVAPVFRTRKWPLKLFWGIMDIAIANAYVLYKHHTGKSDHSQFMHAVADSLIELNPDNELARAAVAHDDQHIIKRLTQNGRPAVRVCAVCLSQTRTGCDTCNIPCHSTINKPCHQLYVDGAKDKRKRKAEMPPFEN